MARALNIAPRTLYRLRQRFEVPWPPFDDWDAVVKLAGGGEQAELEQTDTSWLVTYTLREQRWVSARTVDEAIAKMRAEMGPRIEIVGIQRA